MKLSRTLHWLNRRALQPAVPRSLKLSFWYYWGMQYKRTWLPEIFTP